MTCVINLGSEHSAWTPGVGARFEEAVEVIVTSQAKNRKAKQIENQIRRRRRIDGIRLNPDRVSCADGEAPLVPPSTKITVPRRR